MTSSIVSPERLRELLCYNTETGVFTWRVSRRNGVKPGAVAGTIKRDGYRYIGIDGREYAAHRLAWLAAHGSWCAAPEMDHHDRDKDNVSISNLRPASTSLNQANRLQTRKNTSGFKGVTIHCGGRFQAQIKCSGKNYYLGLFDSPEAASAAYAAKANEFFGEFARRA